MSKQSKYEIGTTLEECYQKLRGAWWYNHLGAPIQTREYKTGLKFTPYAVTFFSYEYVNPKSLGCDKYEHLFNWKCISVHPAPTDGDGE